MTPDKHTDEHGIDGRRTCVIHDDHWQDDIHYAYAEDGLRSPTYADMLAILQNDLDGATEVSRFLLITVDNETGSVQVRSNPGTTNATGINLLAKAIAIISFQEAHQMNKALADIMIENLLDGS